MSAKSETFAQQIVVNLIFSIYLEASCSWVQPPADVLNRLADLLETSVDFLINGNSDQKAIASLKNSELLHKFKEVEVLPEREQSVIVEIMSAYIRDFRSRQNYANAV